MQQLSKPTFSQQVFDLVKQRIRNGDLRPGDRISEVNLAAECGISRAPVREALYLLESEGFLMSHPGRGRCVTMLTPQSVRDRYEFCGVLEGAAAYSALPNMDETCWKKLKSVLDCMKPGAGCIVDDVEKAELSTIFHNIILDRATNPLLAETSRKTARIVSKYLMFQEWRGIYSPEEMHERHMRIYTALLTGEQVLIERAFREHYLDAGSRLADRLERATEAARTRPRFSLRGQD